MKLLIIGNGFDKAASLNSGFDDFIKTRFNEFFSSDATVAEVLEFFNSRNKKTTFIEKCCLLFKIKNNLDELFWSDVEGILYQLLNDGEYSVENAIRYMSRENLIKGNPIHNTNSRDFIIILFALINFEFNIFFRDDDYKFVFDDNLDIYRTLKEDLKRFEFSFFEFLKTEIKTKNDEYNSHVENLTKLLIGRGNRYNVLSFNYTQPDFFNNVLLENVHGTLYKIDEKTANIIIGIDSTEIDHDSKSYPFTKTFRKVELFTKKKDKKIVDVLNNIFLYSEIVIYGHSLNKQDYAYFQTIFDKYKLYDSRIKLTFCYSNYETNNEETLKQKHVKMICSLIEMYGRTFDNEYKGKNLLHKLLNEQRLKITEI